LANVTLSNFGIAPDSFFVDDAERFHGFAKSSSSMNVTSSGCTAPVARRMKAYVADRVRACASKEQIKDELVAQFGRGVLAEPPRKGFDLLAWVLPLGGVLVAALAVGALAWRWTRAGDDVNGAAPELDPELERRLDAELARFE